MFKITPSVQKPSPKPYHFNKFIITLSYQKQKKLQISQKESQNGRWTKEEHSRFIEAIIKYGNDWKKVQRYVATRTSTQARSHAQKFLMKLKRCDRIKKKKINLNLSWAKSIALIKKEFSPNDLRDLLFSVSTNKKRKISYDNKREEEESASTNEDETFALPSTDDVMDFNTNLYNEDIYNEDDTYEIFNNNKNLRKDSEYIKNFINNFNTRKISFDTKDIDAIYFSNCGQY